MKNQLIAANGSVQGLDIPQDLKDLYKTVWEISQKTLIDMSADRGAFVDQSQSFNVHVTDANFGKITSMHFYGELSLLVRLFIPLVDCLKTLSVLVRRSAQSFLIVPHHGFSQS